MDVGAFVQENKRWLLGCAIGGVVYLIASAVIASVYEANAPSARSLGAPTSDVFDASALTAAQDERDQLAAERTRLQQELAFVPSSKYQVANNGSPDTYLFQVGRALKQEMATSADARDVQLADWEPPNAVDDIPAALFGLELVDEVQQRLFAAHDAARATAPDSVGLRAITSLKPELRRGQRPARSMKPGEVDWRDFLVQEQVTFQFQADEATLAGFLERCREPGRTLVIDSWQVTKPQKAGDACAVKGALLGIAFKPQKEGE